MNKVQRVSFSVPPRNGKVQVGCWYRTEGLLNTVTEGERERERKGLWLCLSALVPGVGFSAASSLPEPLDCNLCCPPLTVLIEHGAATELSSPSLFCCLCSQTSTGQSVHDCWSLAASLQRQAPYQRRIGATSGPRVPASS